MTPSAPAEYPLSAALRHEGHRRRFRRGQALFTEGDIAAFEADPLKFTIQARLVDRFGDNGMHFPVTYFHR